MGMFQVVKALWGLKRRAKLTEVPPFSVPVSMRVCDTHSGCLEQGEGNREFEDLRRTCLSQWLTDGLKEFDVMNLAGHACFETTRTFYLSVRRDLIDRARVVSERSEEARLVARPL